MKMERTYKLTKAQRKWLYTVYSDDVFCGRIPGMPIRGAEPLDDDQLDLVHTMVMFESFYSETQRHELNKIRLLWIEYKKSKPR